MRVMCPMCGKTIVNAGSNRRYCSAACRMKAAKLRKAAREAVPDLPEEAMDLFDAFARLRYVESDFACVAAVSEPRTRAIALRVTEAIADILAEEGML